MKKTITLSIPEPCNENWSKMTPSEKGKFCQVCTKEVIDFTSITDEAIVKHTLQNKKVCGRFKSSQLNRPLTLERKSGTPLAPIAASLLLPLSLFANDVASSKNTTLKKPFISLNVGSFPNSDRAQVTYQGTITDQNGNPIPKVTIKVLETGKTVYGTKKGTYKISFLDRDTLLFSAPGFENFEWQAKHFSETKNIQLKKQTGMVRGNIVPTTIKVDTLTQKKKTTLLSISGTITDDSGLPLPSANIIIKGTSNGTQTDFDGYYSIQAKEGDHLVISYIGFITQEIKVSKQQIIHVNMEVTDEVLGGMVVVGYALTDDSKNILGYPRNTYHQDPEREAKVTKRKAAYKQTQLFKRLNTARKKAARKAKRELRKKKNKF